MMKQHRGGRAWRDDRARKFCAPEGGAYRLVITTNIVIPAMTGGEGGEARTLSDERWHV